MTNKYDWLLKKTPRSVDNIRLWTENPRLNPEENYLTVTDFAEGMISSSGDSKNFITLAKSIVKLGFIPADPIVLWQDDNNNHYYVAEGNRRVLVLKLLRKPTLAPKSIRATFMSLSQKIDHESINKIPVSIAPTFEDAEWYVAQRNSITSSKRPWEAEQLRRWIMDLYYKYDKDISLINARVDLSESELKKHIRFLKLKDLVNDVKDKLTSEEFELASSFRFPITTFERFFASTAVKERWGLIFNDSDFNIISVRSSFLIAFSEVIKRMILPKGNEWRIDSRILHNAYDISKILDTLPAVSFESEDENEDSSTASGEGSTSSENNNNYSDNSGNSRDSNDTNTNTTPPTKPKDDPKRNKLIHSSYYLESDEYRLIGIFGELKKISIQNYKNATAASIRVFLDLAILNFIKAENIEVDIKKQYKTDDLKNVNLKKRLDFIKQRSINSKAKNVIGKLVNSSDTFSLDVLNGYHHSRDNHFINKEHLNRFWDYLLPLLKVLVVIKERDE